MTEQNKIYEYISEHITQDFLKEFRYQLFRIFGHTVKNFFGIIFTAGWFAAFGKTCLIKNDSILRYYKSLDNRETVLFNNEMAALVSKIEDVYTEPNENQEEYYDSAFKEVCFFK